MEDATGAPECFVVECLLLRIEEFDAQQEDEAIRKTLARALLVVLFALIGLGRLRGCGLTRLRRCPVG